MRPGALPRHLNPHTVGIVMKECARRAMLEIRKQRLIFSSRVKSVDYKAEEDLVTSADLAAQEIYVRIISENFPMAGIIAEENFSRACTDPHGSYYFTIDPLDGTKAYGRKQSHGVSTMIALVVDGQVVAATIGDPNAMEIYHTRPSSFTVHRIYDFEQSEKLAIDSDRPLTDQYVLLRESLSKHTHLGTAIAENSSKLFRGIEVMGGSIGTMFARLWKSEVGAILLPAGTTTAWDMCPVYGISGKLGFRFFELDQDREHSDALMPFTYSPAERTEIPHELLCVHSSRMGELIAHLNKVWGP